MNTTGKANEDLRFHVAVFPAVENLPISHGFKKRKRNPEEAREETSTSSQKGRSCGALHSHKHMFTWHTSKKQKENNKCNMKQKNDR